MIIQSFYLFESSSDIDAICNKFKIKNYTVNKNRLIDVDGDVNLTMKGLKKLPLNFGEVSGHFHCFYNKLTSLIGSPRSIGGSFNCSQNDIKSLEGIPESIGLDFGCGTNKLISLDRCPKEIKGDFHCSGNRIISLKKGPLIVNGHFGCRNNRIFSFEYLPDVNPHKTLDFSGNPISSVHSLFGYMNREVLEFLKEYNPCRDPLPKKRKGNLIWQRLSQCFSEFGMNVPHKEDFTRRNFLNHSIVNYYNII